MGISTIAFPGLGLVAFLRRFSPRGYLHRPKHALPTPSRLPGLARSVRRAAALTSTAALLAVAAGLGWWEA